MGLVGEIGQEGAPVCTDEIVDLPSVRIFYHLDLSYCKTWLLFPSGWLLNENCICGYLSSCH